MKAIPKLEYMNTIRLDSSFFQCECGAEFELYSHY
jgi:hypothetical protein